MKKLEQHDISISFMNKHKNCIIIIFYKNNCRREKRGGEGREGEGEGGRFKILSCKATRPKVDFTHAGISNYNGNYVRELLWDLTLIAFSFFLFSHSFHFQVVF